MSAIFALAADEWKRMKEQYDLYHEAAYRHAETACNGVLLNERGKKADVDPYSLFKGPWVRAKAYASEELIEHWSRNPRLTVAEFESQWRDYVEVGAA